MKTCKFTAPQWITALLIAFMFATPLLAQERGPRDNRRMDSEQRLEQHVERLGERLGVTDAQRSELQGLVSDRRDLIREWMDANPDATRQERREFMREYRVSAWEAASEILTEDQLEAIRNMRLGGGRRAIGLRSERMRSDDVRRDGSIRPERMGNGSRSDVGIRAGRFRSEDGRRTRGRRAGALRINIDERLGLSEEQGDQLRTVREEHRAALRTWLQENPDATREERTAFIEEHRQEGRERREAIFTPEQLEMHERIRYEQRERMIERRSERGVRSGRSQGRFGNSTSSGWGESGQNPDGNIEAEESETSGSFELRNYPNPFNPSTEIRFILAEAAHVSLTVYDVQGREVRNLIGGNLGAGAHSVSFDAENLTTGTYVYRLAVGDRAETGRMLFLK